MSPSCVFSRVVSMYQVFKQCIFSGDSGSCLWALEHTHMTPPTSAHWGEHIGPMEWTKAWGYDDILGWVGTVRRAMRSKGKEPRRKSKLLTPTCLPPPKPFLPQVFGEHLLHWGCLTELPPNKPFPTIWKYFGSLRVFLWLAQELINLPPCWAKRRRASYLWGWSLVQLSC